MKSSLWTSLGFALLGLSLTGCPHKAQVKDADVVAPVATPPANPTTASDEPSLRGKEYKEVADLVTIYFDLDQSILRSDARDSLQKNYQALTQHPDWEVLVEGHCDERGTTEYNLGLGQKRAASVRQYYISLGLAGNRVATISYGKENPICSDHTDDCWMKNRRGVTKVRINPEQPAATTPAASDATSPAAQ